MTRSSLFFGRRSVVLAKACGGAYVAIVLWVGGACGSSVDVDGAGAGGAGATTPTTTTTSTGVTSTTTTYLTSYPPCESFLPPPGITPLVDIILVNDTEADLFIGEDNPGCGGVEPFDLWQSSGDPPALYDGSLGVCELSCAELQTSGCECAADCMMPYVIRITPGGSYTATWIGYVYERTEMTSYCFHDPNCGPSCPQEMRPPATLRVTSAANSEVGCSSGTCTCEPDSDGSCFIYDGSPSIAGQVVSAEAVWSEGQTSVTITFTP